MRFVQDNRDHAYFHHEWLVMSPGTRLWTMVSPGDKDISATLMGDIAIKQLKMNSAEEFRAALRGDIPRRYLDPDASWDGKPLD